MKSLKVFGLVLLILSILAILQLSCQKETVSNTAAGFNTLKVYLTDAPINFDKVLIDIRQVVVKIENDSCAGENHHHSGDDNSGGSGSNDDHSGSGSGSGGHHDDDACYTWDTLQVNAGIYDLLQFRNGVDALLGSGHIPTGEIKAVRIVLGYNNSVVVDSTSYPLSLSGSNSVTIKVDGVEVISEGNFQLHLDFDLGNSISRIYGSRFELRPIIRSFNDHSSGRIEGRVLPANARVVVVAYGNSDTLAAIPEKDGRFKIRGIRSSQVNLHFNATAGGYRDSTIRNININPERETETGSVTLHQ